MQRSPYLIALLVTLLLAYPLYLIAFNGDSASTKEASTALIAMLSAIALVSLVSAILARPVTKKRTNGRNKNRRRSNAAPRASRDSAPTGGPREHGTVKWFNATKGFGFITRDSGDDVFVHFRSIRGEGHRTLRDGERVDFVVSDGDKGLQADDVASA